MSHCSGSLDDKSRYRRHPHQRLRVAYIFQLLVLGVLFSIGSPQPDLQFKQYNLNIASDLIAISVGSYARINGRPQSLTPQTCEDRCRHTAGCTAWSYCNKLTGCYGACQEYIKRNPPYPADAKEPNRVTRAATMPLIRPGPFGSLCTTQQQHRNNWAHGTCSLWRVKTQANGSPLFWSNRTTDGWIAGVAKVPAQCAGLSIASCSSCLGVRDVPGCVRCARTAISSSSLDVITSRATLVVAAEACGQCYQLDNPAPCVTCLARNSTCAMCPTSSLANTANLDQHPGRFFNLQACMDCLAAHGPTLARACNDCSRQRGNLDRVRCMACLPQLKGSFCGSEAQEKAPVAAGQSACIPQTQCGLCARSPMHDQCMACATAKPYRRDCFSCMGMLGAAEMTGCLRCATSSLPGTGVTASPCSECYVFADRANMAVCDACVRRKDIPGEGRNWCRSCTDWWSTGAQQQRCFNCLTKVNNPNQAATCKPAPAG